MYSENSSQEAFFRAQCMEKGNIAQKERIGNTEIIMMTDCIDIMSDEERKLREKQFLQAGYRILKNTMD